MKKKIRHDLFGGIAGSFKKRNKAAVKDKEITDDGHKLKKLKRSELLEIILMLKENERALEEKNEKLTASLNGLMRKIAMRKEAIETDNAIGLAAAEFEASYLRFKRVASNYHVLLEELSENMVEDKLNRGLMIDENE